MGQVSKFISKFGYEHGGLFEAGGQTFSGRFKSNEYHGPALDPMDALVPDTSLERKYLSGLHGNPRNTDFVRRQAWAAEQWGYGRATAAMSSSAGRKFGGKLLGIQRIQPTINPISSNLNWGFDSAENVMQRLKQAGKGSVGKMPGFQALQDIVSGLESYNPKLFLGSASKNPYVQMQLGGSVIDMPFETGGGNVVQGLKHKAARVSIKEGQALTFSDRLVQEFAKIPAGQKPSQAGQEAKKAIQRLHASLTDSAMHGGRPLASRVHFHANQVVFGKEHKFSRELQSITSTLGEIHGGKYRGGAIGREFGGVQKRLKKLYEQVADEGYTVLGSSWDQMQGLESSAARMIATRGDFTIYQGLMAGDPAKGFGHLAQRETINASKMQRLGFDRVAPWVQPRGYGPNQVYELGVNVGILHPELGTRLLGDSGFAFTSERTMRAFAEFPNTTTRTVHARIMGVGGDKVERSFSPAIESLFKKYGVDKHLEGDQVFNFPTKLKATQFDDFKNIIGQSIGQGAAGSTDLSAGQFETVPDDMLMTGVRARRRSHHMEYEFLFSAEKGTLDMARSTAVMGTRRMSAKGAYGYFGKKYGTDILVRSQEFWGRSFGKDFAEAGFVSETAQAGLAGRWLTLSKQRGGTRAQQDVAGILGLGGINNTVKRGGERMYTAGNDWIIKQDMVDNLRAYFGDPKNKSLNDLAKNDMFFVTKQVIPKAEFRDAMHALGITNAVEIARYQTFNDAGTLFSQMEAPQLRLGLPWQGSSVRRECAIA